MHTCNTTTYFDRIEYTCSECSYKRIYWKEEQKLELIDEGNKSLHNGSNIPGIGLSITGKILAILFILLFISAGYLQRSVVTADLQTIVYNPVFLRDTDQLEIIIEQVKNHDLLIQFEKMGNSTVDTTTIYLDASLFPRYKNLWARRDTFTIIGDTTDLNELVQDVIPYNNYLLTVTTTDSTLLNTAIKLIQ